MATKVKSISLPLPASLVAGSVGPLVKIDCYAHHACISASGDFAGGQLSVEVSYDGELWNSPSGPMSSPGAYPMGEPSVYARVVLTLSPPVGSVMSVRLVAGGAVDDGCCDPCNRC